MLRLKRVLPTSSQSHVFMKVNSSIRYMYVIFISPTLFYVLKGWLNLQHRHGSFGGTSKKSYQRSSTRNEGIAAITNELMKKRLLLLAVLRREIERLSIWRNPKNATELRIPGEDIVQGWASQMPMVDKTWKECIRTAWRVCPYLAVHVALKLVFYIFLFIFICRECLKESIHSR